MIVIVFIALLLGLLMALLYVAIQHRNQDQLFNPFVDIYEDEELKCF